MRLYNLTCVGLFEETDDDPGQEMTVRDVCM